MFERWMFQGLALSRKGNKNMSLSLQALALILQPHVREFFKGGIP